MQHPTPPIFVNEHGDLGVYATAEDAQHDLEAIDVNNKEYVAYDAEGRLLRLETPGDEVLVSLAEPTPNHTGELEQAIRGFLRRLGDPTSEDAASTLATLVAYCRRFINPVEKHVLKQFVRELIQEGVRGFKRLVGLSTCRPHGRGKLRHPDITAKNPQGRLYYENIGRQTK